MYMNVLTLVLTDNRSIDSTLMICESFTCASGLRVNKHKSKLLYLSWREIKEKWGLLEESETINILGVHIGKDMGKINWEYKLLKIQAKLLQWKNRDLSLSDKLLVLKSELIASLDYLATTLPIPFEVLVSLWK